MSVRERETGTVGGVYDDMLEVFEKGCHANGGVATMVNIPNVKMQICARLPAGRLRAK